MPDVLPLGTPIGATVEGPPNTTIRYDGSTQFRSVDVAPIWDFVIQAGAGVSAALVSHWLIGKFRGRVSHLTINRRVVDLDDEGQVRRVVEDAIELEQKD
jgi:hypothetical protein